MYTRALRNNKGVDYKCLNEGNFDESMDGKNVVTDQPKTPAKQKKVEHEDGAFGGDLRITVNADGKSDKLLLHLTREIDVLKVEKEKLKRIEELSQTVCELKIKGSSKDPVQGLSLGKGARSKMFLDEVQLGKLKSRKGVKVDSSSGLSLSDLKKDRQVQATVSKHLKELGLGFSDSNDSSGSSSGSSGSDSDSSDSSKGSSGSDQDKRKKKGKHKGKSRLRSGMVAKNSDDVKFPQLWPQKGLKKQFVTSKPKFKDLDFRLFVAGELEIISRVGIRSTERKGRLRLLKEICYHQNSYEWEALRDCYASVVKNIELGISDWSEDLFKDCYMMLAPFVRKPFQKKGKFKNDFSSTKSDGKMEKVWFCKDYNRNRCSHSESHKHLFQGRSIFAHHICAVCWLKDKVKLQHPECSSACPHAISA